MKLYDQNDFQALLDMLPATPENTQIAQQIQAMIAEQGVIRQPYTFEVDFTTGTAAAGAFAAPLAAGGQTAGNFLVDSSSPFMLCETAVWCDLAAAAQTSGTEIVPNAVVFISDQSSNRNWMNFPVPIKSLFGSAERPFYWPQPRLIPANTNVQVVVTNYEAANVNNIRLSFHGWRYYAVGQ